MTVDWNEEQKLGNNSRAEEVRQRALIGAEEQRSRVITEKQGHGNLLNEAIEKIMTSIENGIIRGTYGLYDGRICKIQSIQAKSKNAEFKGIVNLEE